MSKETNKKSKPNKNKNSSNKQPERKPETVIEYVSD